MTDLSEQLRAARMQYAEREDVGFRKASDLWEGQIKGVAKELQEDAKKAYDDGYPVLQLAFKEASVKVLTRLRGMKKLIAEKPVPNTQASLDLEKKAS